MLHVLQPTLVWEGSCVDTWSIAHLMAGVFIAYALTWLRLNRWQGLAAAVIIGGIWEGIEQFVLHTRVTETNANSLMDVVCASLGYLAGYEILQSQWGKRNRSVVLTIATLLFLTVCALRVLGA